MGLTPTQNENLNQGPIDHPSVSELHSWEHFLLSAFRDKLCSNSFMSFTFSDNALPNRLNSKFQDYDSHRPGNRYEFAPSNSAILKTRQMHSKEKN